MKYLLFSFLLFAACTSSKPKDVMGPPAPAEESVAEEKKSWFCHAISAQNEARAHGEGHGASCEGTEECARKKALEACSRYHKDCEIVFCTE